MQQPNRSTRRHIQQRKAFQTHAKKHNLPCWICGQPINYEAPYNSSDPDRLQLDHLLPVSTHPELLEDPANFRPAHASCNQARGNKAPRPGIGHTSKNW